MFDVRCSMFDAFRCGPLQRAAPWAFVALFTVFAPPALAVVPATLVDTRLDTESVQLAGVRDDVLLYFDHERRLREAPLRNFVQIRAIGQTPQTPHVERDDVAAVRLVDGQTLPGRWVRGLPDGEGFVWSHAHFGELTIPMQDVAALTLSGDPIVERDGTDDVVHLSNGDQLRGFVAGVKPVGLSLIPAGGDAPIALPIDRVAAVRLANPAQSRSDADRVMLTDGTVLLAQRIVIAGDEAAFDAALPGQAMRVLSLPLSWVARIELSAGGVELVDLGTLPRQLTSGGEVFGLTTPPRFGPTTVVLHAPLTLRFELPPGTTRFAAEASLPTGSDVSGRLLEFADFELIVRLESGQPIERLRFNAAHPRHSINLALPVSAVDEALLLELDAGVDGPVFDRLELRHPTLLIAPTDAGAVSEAAGW